MSTVHRVPAEIWQEIFKDLPAGNLDDISRTSKELYRLSVRPLYRNLKWTTVRRCAASLSVFSKQPELASAVREVTIDFNLNYEDTMVSGYATFDHYGFEAYSSESDTEVEDLVHGVPDSDNDLAPIQGPSRPTIQERLYPQVAAFVNLHTLTFLHAAIPSNIYYIISSLPNLQNLSISNSDMPNVPSGSNAFSHFAPYSLASLQINDTERAVTYNSGIIDMLNFVSGPNLRSLNIVWSNLLCHKLTIEPDFTITPALRTLTISLPQVPIGGFSPKTHPPINRFEVLMQRCSSLQHLHIRAQDYINLRNFRNQEPILPNLRSYKGPIRFAFKLAGSLLQQLDITEVVMREGLNTVTDAISPRILVNIVTIGEKFPILKSLSFSLIEYSSEVWFPLKNCTSLENLTIYYKSGYPTENEVLQMGSEHLLDMRNLCSLKLYNPLAKSPRSIDYHVPLEPSYDCVAPYMQEGWDDAGTLDLILPWSKPCKPLREVQLVSWNIWKRCSDRATWEKTNISPDSGICANCDLASADTSW